MSTDLATRTSATGSITVHNMDDLARLGRMLADSGYFQDAKDAAQCGVKVLAGLEMGFGAFASMSGIHLISGKPAIGANLMAARVKASGKYDFRVRRLDDDACEIEFFQAGESLGTSAFTREDAKRAGTKNLDKFPRNMLYARAMSNGVKWYTPDVFLGAPVYTPEELGADVDSEGNVIDIPSRPTPRAPEKPVEASDAPPWAEGPPEPEDAPNEPPPASSDGITPNQMKALQAVLKKQNLDGAVAKQFFAWLLKRDIGSSKELTKADASRVIGWSQEQWEKALEDYAVVSAGGPPEEDAA